jgi:hypothetical protein
MTITDIIGSLGVFILLLAFLLNLINKITKNNFLYIFMNLTGASLACIASVMLNYIPFIILEGAWALVSGAALLRKVL